MAQAQSTHPEKAFTAALASIPDAVERFHPVVEFYITAERVRRYLSSLSDTPAPSTAAGAFRLPVLKALLRDDGAFDMPGFVLHENFENTGSPVIITGRSASAKKLWYFAHLDTVSYLVQPRVADAYPLVPFCYHLMTNGLRTARAYRYSLDSNHYNVIAEGELHSIDGRPSFHPARGSAAIWPGDRIVPYVNYQEDRESGEIFAHVDNAGGVAALAVAALVLAQIGIDAFLGLPDEEEGPPGAGSQVMGRGSSRIVSLLSPPDIAIIADVQQAGGGKDADTRDGVENSTRLGRGAVLAEFSSLGRGAVTPPHLYALAQRFREAIATVGVSIQESNNAYSSRSDDVSVLLKTPNILLLGFPGFNRHFDLGPPRANLHDVVNLAKALVYYSAIVPVYRELVLHMGGGRA